MNNNLLYAFLFVIIFSFFSCKKHESEVLLKEVDGTPEGTAVVITGAAARIGQEAALLRRLHETGQLDDVQFISGISAGGINTVALNAILEGKYTWDEYESLLFSLTNDSVFVNPHNNLPVDTRPLRKLFERIVNKEFGYTSFSDLPYPCVVSAVRLKDHKVVRIGNIGGFDGYHLSGDIVDGLMATTSIPGAMPGIKINGDYYVDGGVKETVQYKSVLEYQLIRNKPFKKIYVVSYQRNGFTDWNKEMNALGLTGKNKFFLKTTLDQSGFNIDKVGRANLMKDLTKLWRNYPQLGSRTYVYIPNIPGLPYNALFDFTNQESQISYAKEWCLSNNPILVTSYTNN